MEIEFPESTLWKEVITTIYGMEDKWMTKLVTSPYNCSVWRSIRKLWPLVINRSYFKVGNGEKVAFWNHSWCDQVPLKQAFPELYILCQLQLVTVTELWTGQE